jgi:hypothetical protein
VALVDYDRQAEEKIIAAILYPHARHPLAAAAASRRSYERRSGERFSPNFSTKRRHRRDKLGRAFENVYYTFDILGNLGLYRDLAPPPDSHPGAPGLHHRARLRHAAGNRGSRFQGGVRRLHDARGGVVRADLPRASGEAQYVVPFAYKIRWYMKMNLREALHMCRAPHHAPGPSRLPFHLPGDVAQDPGRFIRRWPKREGSSTGKSTVLAVCSRR